MSGAPETRYTDRDVRESIHLAERAVEYVENYAGDFQYLIDMKLRLAQGEPLTTPMIRGVLNCMRHDPRIRDMPAPLPPDEVATVTPIRQRRPRRRSYGGQEPCGETTEHGYHTWTDEEANTEYHCQGWHLINRLKSDDHGYLNPNLFMDAAIKRPFAAARGGRFVHLAVRGHVRWGVMNHEWGYSGDPELIVKLACKYPSFLNQPHLLNPEQAQQVIEMGEREFCPHCAAVMA